MVPSWPTRNSTVPGPDVTSLDQDRLRRAVQPLGLHGREERCRSLLDQLLVPPLQRAVPRRHHHHIAVGVGQALGFDVSGSVQVTLDEALAPTEGGDRLPGGGLEELVDLRQLAHDLQPAPATAVRGLDRDGQSVLLGERPHLGGVGHRVRGARHQGSADQLSDVPSLHLVPEGVDGRRRRTDPDQSGVDHRSGEGGVLGQEPVPGMDGVRPALGRGGQQLGDVEVGLAGCRAAQRVRLVGQLYEQCVGVGFGVDRHTGDAGVGGGADHPNRDLASIGNQHLADRHGILLDQLRVVESRPNRTASPGRSWAAWSASRSVNTASTG